MNTPSILLVTSMLAFAALAGCAAPADDGDQAPTPGTGATPASPTPSSPTPATPTPDVPAVGAEIARVLVVSAPESAEAGADAEVCFRVEGRGTIPHVAVHYDTESHPDAESFQDYAGGAAYPGGAAAAFPVTLPGVFCAPVPVGEQTVYFRAHALNPPDLPGVLSEENAITVGATGIRFVSDLPEIASAGTTFTACWEVPDVAGTGSVPHTAIHFDTASHPSSTSFQDYAGGAAYPDNATSAAAEGYTVPGTFCSNLEMPAEGALYFRAHVLVPDQANNLSIERNVVVAPAIAVVSALPETAAAGEAVTVCWRVEGEGSIPHTAVHFDTETHPSSTSFQDYDGGAAYPDNASAAAAEGYQLPGTFCSDVTMPDEGALYFRAHVLVPDERNELSDEYVVQVA